MVKKKTYKYVNKSEQDQAIIGVGEVAAGKTIEAGQKINNPNLRMVGVDPVTKPVAAGKLSKKVKK